MGTLARRVRADRRQRGVAWAGRRVLREGAADELAAVNTRMSSRYSTGKIAYDGRQVALDELETLMGAEHDPLECATQSIGVSQFAARDLAQSCRKTCTSDA